MYKFKNSLIALVGLVTLIAITTVLTARFGYGSSGTGNSAPTSQTQNVNVVNTPTVGLANGSSVAINGTPTVQIANIPTQTPFHKTLNFSFNGEGDSQFTTENGKTTVIRSYSLQVAAAQGVPVALANIQIRYTLDPDYGYVFPALVRSAGNAGTDTYVANDAVDIRIPGGITVYCNVIPQSGSFGYAQLSLFGYTE